MTTDLTAMGTGLRAAPEPDSGKRPREDALYRVVFRMAGEAICVVDAATLRVLDANLAASRLLDVPVDRLISAPVGSGMELASRRVLEESLAAAGDSGRPVELRCRRASDGTLLHVVANPFRHDGTTLLLVHARAANGDAPEPSGLPLDALVEHVPDAVVLSDGAGRILMANPAFLDLSGLVSEESARGRALADWVGRRENDLAMILAVLKNHGTVRGLPTSLRGEHGEEVPIELSAALVPGSDGHLIGFIVRSAARRSVPDAEAAADLGTAVEGLTDRVGSVSLPDLVRDTTDLVERHFIRAALELTGGNRTTAADVLGLSRQSLYVKLRRHRLRDGGPAGRPAAD